MHVCIGVGLYAKVRERRSGDNLEVPALLALHSTACVQESNSRPQARR